MDQKLVLELAPPAHWSVRVASVVFTPHWSMKRGGGNEIEGVEGGRLANLAILNIKSIQLCYDLRRDLRGRLKKFQAEKKVFLHHLCSLLQ
ncbi:hypothetical protein CDAR_43441 [Caerostris darwini]|uniref:Uncharacterized protein n=1 Tax=Caerostris darwini TaxID=1538125 RepID=A0AAV4WJE3_9ARAC|nr:hypothetical protein CDAR_43441 [Caerostris darwini]